LDAAERYALTNGLFCTATSKAMALALNEYYQIHKKITVIYNGFPATMTKEIKAEGETLQKSDRIRLLWFSRNIGTGRGLEFLLNALWVCQIPVELHLLGMMDEEYKDFLDNNFPSENNHKLVLHSFLPYHELGGFISQFDIGLAIEENVNDNKILTISNKLLQYLQAGLPVLASDTKGQREVAGYFPETVKLVDIHNPLQWEMGIDFLRNVDAVNRQKQKETFQKIYSWEAQEKKLDNLLAKYS